MFLLLSLPLVARADIYRWEDENGVLHFTDDVSNIPAAYRGKVKMFVKEPTEPVPPPSSPAERGVYTPPSTYLPAPSREDEAEAAAREAESLSTRIEQLKARISAKENLVKTVENRQNLALNPLRNRVVDPGDMELYRKYRAELPGDREQLKELESRLLLVR